jgi:hypothetical protein
MFQARVVEGIKHAFYFQYFFKENHAVSEVTWKNIVEPDRPQMTVWRVPAFPAGYLRLKTHPQCK